MANHSESEGEMNNASILILCKNEAANLGPCLDAVFGQRGVGEFEVIVVDSGSTDGTIEIARQYPIQLKQIPAEDFHHARTRNYAASLANGGYLVYLAGDARPTADDWLQRLLGHFDDPDVAAVYGRQVAKEGATRERRATFNLLYPAKPVVKDRAKKRELGYRYYHFATVNAAIRRSVWEAGRFPDEVKVFEDIAIAKIILDRGLKIVYEPEAAVYHSHNHSLQDVIRRYFDTGATWRRLGMWDAEARASMIRDALRILQLPWGERHQNGEPGSPPERLSVTEVAAKSFGFALGLNERFLPLVVKRRLSAFKLFE